MDIVFFLELEKVKLYQDSLSIGNGMLYGNFYRSELYGLPHIFVSVNTISSTKRLRLNEKSSILWHKLLGHISKQIIERLIKDEILLNLNFSYFNTCVDCIKGILTTKIRNVKANKCIELLRVIHIDICGPFTPHTMGSDKYFITFIDDYSYYGFVELINDKSDSLGGFKGFKAKGELQQGKNIKVVHSKRGGEYHGRYDETGRNPGPFVSTFRKVALTLIIQCLVEKLKISQRICISLIAY